MKWHSSGWWTIALCFIVILDSIVTVIIGEEANPFILWVMEIWNIGLVATMGLIRLVYYIPLIYIVHKYNAAWVALILYIGIYSSFYIGGL